jgi:alpha-glucuronidase
MYILGVIILPPVKSALWVNLDSNIGIDVIWTGTTMQAANGNSFNKIIIDPNVCV